MLQSTFNLHINKSTTSTSVYLVYKIMYIIIAGARDASEPARYDTASESLTHQYLSGIQFNKYLL